MRAWWRRLSKPYEPTDVQWLIHTSPHRERLVAGGERSGKSFSSAMAALPYTLDSKLGWIVAADYRQSRAEYNYLKNAYIDLGLLLKDSTPISEYQTASFLTRTGLEVRTMTAADESKLGMVAPDWIIAAEAAQLQQSIYLRLRGRLAETRGWLLLEGTFEEAQDWYADLWEAWRAGTPDGQISFSMPSWSNTAVFPGGWDDPEMIALRKALHYPDSGRFMERHGGVPSLPLTAVFPTFSHAHHVGIYPFDPDLPVELAIDPGFAGGYAVLAVQHDNNHVYVIDEVYERGKSAREVIRICRKRPWWGNVRAHRAGIIDIAAKQHHEGESHLEIWAAHPSKGGAGVALSSVFVPIVDGIERLRSFLSDPVTGMPRIYYNADTTASSVREYKLYQYPKDVSGRPIREKPIDRDNHAIKAITYWLVARYGWANRTRTGTRAVVYGASNARQQDSVRRPQRGTGHRQRTPRAIAFGHAR